MEFTAIASLITAALGFISNHFLKEKKLKKQIKQGSGKVVKGAGAVIDAGHATAKVATAIQKGRITAQQARDIWKRGKDAYQTIDELVSDDEILEEAANDEIEKKTKGNG